MNDADFEGLEGEDGMVAEEAAGDGEGIDVSCCCAAHQRRTCLPHSYKRLVGAVPVATCSCSDARLWLPAVCMQELEAMKQKLKELEEEAAKLRNTQVGLQLTTQQPGHTPAEPVDCACSWAVGCLPALLLLLLAPALQPHPAFCRHTLCSAVTPAIIQAGSTSTPGLSVLFVVYCRAVAAQQRRAWRTTQLQTQAVKRRRMRGRFLSTTLTLARRRRSCSSCLRGAAPSTG